MSYPASYDALMSVAAVDSNENKASFSQYNAQVEIAGPGVNVKSTLPNNQYASYSGTSMATPPVAGVAALVWSHFPDCKAWQIRNVLAKTAKEAGSAGCDTSYGFESSKPRLHTIFLLLEDAPLEVRRMQQVLSVAVLVRIYLGPFHVPPRRNVMIRIRAQPTHAATTFASTP